LGKKWKRRGGLIPNQRGLWEAPRDWGPPLRGHLRSGKPDGIHGVTTHVSIHVRASEDLAPQKKRRKVKKVGKKKEEVQGKVQVMGGRERDT